jgi:hypothetical protein
MPQSVPFAEQCARLAVVSTHAPPQNWMGAPPKHVMPHAPALQPVPALQVVPHAPQFSGSVCVSAQRPPHATVGFAHVAAHAPAEQTDPAAHFVPHVPQFVGLVCVSTQAPLQTAPAAPPGQPHTL